MGNAVRYTLGRNGQGFTGMAATQDGAWVMAEDYDALKAERDTYCEALRVASVSEGIANGVLDQIRLRKEAEKRLHEAGEQLRTFIEKMRTLRDARADPTGYRVDLGITVKNYDERIDELAQIVEAATKCKSEAEG